VSRLPDTSEEGSFDAVVETIMMPAFNFVGAIGYVDFLLSAILGLYDGRGGVRYGNMGDKLDAGWGRLAKWGYRIDNAPPSAP